MYYNEDLIEEIRSRNDIVDVIGSYVNLKKKGNTYMACCPFHQEKTPSFSVSRDKQMYHCFGCGVGGSVYTFLMEYESFSFPEAVKELAERAGIDLPEQKLSALEKQQADEKTMIKQMNKLAAGYFYSLLMSDKGKKGYAYFKNRGISDEMILSFGLGYSDIYRDDLYLFLKSKGYTDAQIAVSKLVTIDEKKGIYDKFWSRVMFPIMDVNSRVIGFGGRVLGDGGPKYLNSNDTPVFDKSRNLYGLQIAKKSKKRGIILCEGYMDVISMHQAGFDNAVASLGTAFTMGQANLLKRYTDEIYLAYDCDGAGIKAALRAIQILREFGCFTVRRIDLRPYKDPDELIQKKGVEEFENRVRNAVTDVMYEIQILYEESDQSDPASRTKFQHAVAKVISGLEDPLERANYIDTVSEQYKIDKKSLSYSVNQYGTAAFKEKIEIPERKETQHKSRDVIREDNRRAPMKLLLTWMVNEPELFDVLKNIVSPNDFINEVYRDAAEKLFDQYERTKTVSPATIISEYQDLEKQKMVAELVQTDFEKEIKEEDRSKALTELVKKVKGNRIEWEIQNSSDLSKLQELIEEKAKLPRLHILL